ncbi:hypothetical protein [Leeuwenhoekiella sp. MAR_2009_132]|uniref:hypothetical protein n=1 Tax=Leeuwenhoekiella sp. MAR_2009_132 TaxID=1392489 RepID=UPI00048EABDC|nr:hypothetical protein [Leeuwenhoekiella sp. MAR_2009_132]
MSEKLDDLIIQLSGEDSKIIALGKILAESIGATEYTFFCHSVLNRTINLNRGYLTLLKDQNFIAAAPLVRLNLDSLLRIFASIQSEYDVETFARNVRRGDMIRKMRYSKKAKERLTDTKLVNLLMDIPNFKWVKQVYYAGSGYVHLSNQHFYSSIKIVDLQTVEGGILKTDKYISEDEKIAGTYYMLQSSKGIRAFIGDVLNSLK